MKSTAYANDLLRLEFNAVAIANMADNAAASPLTTYQAALHTGWPGFAGNQSTNEVAYTGYARAAIARNTTGFTVAGNSVTLTSDVAFAQRTNAGSVECPFASIGRAASGAGVINRLVVFGSRMGLGTANVADTLTVPGHTLAVNDRCVLLPVAGFNLPAGITEGALYFVKTVTGNDITLSLTSGGATLDITAAGSGIVYKSTPAIVAQGSSIILQAATQLLEG